MLVFLTRMHDLFLNWRLMFLYLEEKNIPIGVPANLVSFGNNSSPSGHVTDNLSGSLIKKKANIF